MSKRVDHSLQSGFGITAAALVVLVVAVAGYVGWRVWDTSQTNQTTTTDTQNSNNAQDNNTPSQNISKIPEFGAEFEVKDGITVLSGHSFSNGRNGTTMRFSTQQLVDEGEREVNGGDNPCMFDASATRTNDLVYITAYNSVSDILSEDISGKTTAADITSTNGYISVGSRTFYVSTAAPKPAGSPTPYQEFCTTTAAGNEIEKQQWQLLHDSLLTLRTAE